MFKSSCEEGVMSIARGFIFFGFLYEVNQRDEIVNFICKFVINAVKNNNLQIAAFKSF